jgi:hypothetical protein
VVLNLNDNPGKATPCFQSPGKAVLLRGLYLICFVPGMWLFDLTSTWVRIFIIPFEITFNIDAKVLC